jgi:diguanylate cyclase (GGDEF)-like protein
MASAASDPRVVGPLSSEEVRRSRALVEQLAQREDEIALLRETADVVVGELHLDTLCQMVADRARRLIQAETVLIPILDEACSSYTYRAASGRNAEEISGETLPIDAGLCGWVWRHKRPWWHGLLDDLSDEELDRHGDRKYEVILVPLIGKEHFLGGIAGLGKIGGKEFTRRDFDLLTLFASQVAVAIDNARAYTALEEAQREALEYQSRLQELNEKLRESNRDLEKLALYDPVTALPNRSLLLDRIQQGLNVAARDRGPLSVIVLDLDDFKEINDTLGHDAGDTLLHLVGARLNEQVRDVDTVGRLGGDEFAVVLPGSNVAAAEETARRITRAFSAPFTLGANRVVAQASMGIAAFPGHGQDVSALLKCADVAMYVAKRNRSALFVYDPEQDPHSRDRLELIGDLHQAMVGRAFEMHYQPQWHAMRGTVVGMEALARWRHPRQGDIPPTVFIPMLERTGSMHEFTVWALEEALSQCAHFRRHGYDLGISVNLSVHDLRDLALVEELSAILARIALDPERLTLEVTESAAMSNVPEVRQFFDRAGALGVHFAIDDFGTGYSSLSRLLHIPVRELKIDRSFVRQMTERPEASMIVQTIVQLGHNLGLKVNAEGVESGRELEILAGFGCDIVQGNRISPPLPVGDVLRFLKTA